MISSKTTFSLLLLMLLFSVTFAQEPNKLRLTEITIAVNKEPKESLTEVSIDLKNNAPMEIILYKENGLTFGTVFETKHSGKRMKMTRQSFVEKPDGKRKFTRKQKNVDLLKVSVPGRMTGRYAESILYDASKMNNIAVGYKYELHYK
jgi:hypothetical protein